MTTTDHNDKRPWVVKLGQNLWKGHGMMTTNKEAQAKQYDSEWAAKSALVYIRTNDKEGRKFVQAYAYQPAENQEGKR